MERMKQLVFWTLILVAAIALFEVTSLDLWVQDRLLNMETGRWMVDRNDPFLRLLFYTGVKGGIIVFGVVLLLVYGFSYCEKGGERIERSALRQRCLLVILSVIIVPSTIAELKTVTNIYCPSQIERYGGDKPYVKLFNAYPATCRGCDSGRCFPAGHASGGFSLMVLYHVFRKRKHKALGLIAGLGLGWAMGLYQMMKGAHFLSHTVVTMVASWIMILFIVEVARRVHNTAESGGRPGWCAGAH